MCKLKHARRQVVRKDVNMLQCRKVITFKSRTNFIKPVIHKFSLIFQLLMCFIWFVKQDFSVTFSKFYRINLNVCADSKFTHEIKYSLSLTCFLFSLTIGFDTEIKAVYGKFVVYPYISKFQDGQFWFTMKEENVLLCSRKCAFCMFVVAFMQNLFTIKLAVFYK